MKMQNLGRKESEMYGTIAESPSGGKKGKDPVIYPSFHLSNPPDFLMDKDVGHKCRIECVIEIKSKSVDESNGKTRWSVSADIHSMGYKSKAGKLSKDEYLNLPEKEREEYDDMEIGGK